MAALVNPWLVRFQVGNPPKTHSNVFMPIITQAFLNGSNQPFILSADLQNHVNAIVQLIFSGDYGLYQQALTALQQHITNDAVLQARLRDQYDTDKLYTLNEGQLTSFGHITGRNQEVLLEACPLVHGQFSNVFTVLEDLLMRFYHPTMFEKKYLKYKNKYLQLKNKIN